MFEPPTQVVPDRPLRRGETTFAPGLGETEAVVACGRTDMGSAGVLPDDQAAGVALLIRREHLCLGLGVEDEDRHVEVIA